MGDMALCAGNTPSSFLGVHRRPFGTGADPLEGPAVALSKRVAKANHPTGASLPAEPTTAPPPHEFTFVPFASISRFTSFFLLPTSYHLGVVQAAVIAPIYKPACRLTLKQAIIHLGFKKKKKNSSSYWDSS